HNLAGFSTTTGLLLDLSKMRGVQVHRGRGDGRVDRVTVEAGATIGRFYPHLEQHEVIMSTGRCPTVGISGLVLGGGIGFSDRKFGLTCDALVSTQVVTADGELITCDENTHSDLFWACRGGAGGNFGVHTSYTFEVQPMTRDDPVTFYDLRWRNATDDTAKRIAERLQEAVRHAPDEFDLRLGITTSGLPGHREEIEANTTVAALGQHYGDRAELERILRDVLDARPAPDVCVIRESNVWDAARSLFATTPIFKSETKSRILDEPLDAGTVQALVRHVRAYPGSYNEDGAGLAVFAMGGAIARKKRTDTAFVHRDALFIIAVEATWADDDTPRVEADNLRWVDELHRLVPAQLGEAAYQNFPDRDLTDPLTAYYGENQHRLREVKRAYDPHDFFHHAQSIPG
ncbi:FAD-binding oxidoreductase, partial [Actinosynnema sp. NPDC023658]|uniref:FAD-binding oxidoreductase n=1 Tax=Actinosynnema sp. NPDC023658 TaxID=3155465 RepID=UPI0033E01B12